MDGILESKKIILWHFERVLSRKWPEYSKINSTLLLEKRKKERKTEKNKKIFKKVLTNACEFGIITKSRDAGMAQSVEHVIGNDEVISSILITSSKNQHFGAPAIEQVHRGACLQWVTV